MVTTLSMPASETEIAHVGRFWFVCRTRCELLDGVVTAVGSVRIYFSVPHRAGSCDGTDDVDAAVLVPSGSCRFRMLLAVSSNGGNFTSPILSTHRIASRDSRHITMCSLHTAECLHGSDLPHRMFLYLLLISRCCD